MITTYFNKNDFEKYSSVHDGELNRLLNEINKSFGNKYYLQETIVEEKKLFRKTTTKTYYTLYADVGGGEVQIINFAQDHDWSINTSVSKSYIETYFYGMLNGMKQAQQSLSYN